MPKFLTHTTRDTCYSLPCLRLIILCTFLVLTQLTHASEKTHVVVIQPILLYSDDGKLPASIRIDESIIDQTYASSGIDIHFLEPVKYNSSKAKYGKVTRSTIIKHAKADSILRRPKHIINMFFVDVINQKPDPTPIPSWITFVAQGKFPDQQRDADIIIESITKSLGIKKAKQITPVQLTKSSLIKPKVWYMSVKEGQDLLADESYEPFFSALQKREIHALTGEPHQGKTKIQWQKDALKRFQISVLPFTKEEQETLAWFVDKTETLLGNDYPIFTKQPWRFIKLHDRIAGGFPHTRTMSIFYCQRILTAMTRAKEADEHMAMRRFIPLFVHEQMHVLERMYPRRFNDFHAKQYNLTRAKVKTHPWITENQMSNPDAMDYSWIVQIQNDEGQLKPYWLRTILRIGADPPKMGYDFRTMAFELKHNKTSDYYQIITDENNIPIHKPANSLHIYLNQLPVRRGIEHPNEISAYFMGQLITLDYFSDHLNEKQRERANILKNRYEKYRDPLKQLLK